MATDMATPSVQSLIDKFEQLAARSSGRPAPSCVPRRRRARYLSDCSLAFSSCDDLALRRHIPAKLSMDMTSTTSTTSISSDDEEEEEDAVDVDVDVDGCDEQVAAVERVADEEEKHGDVETSVTALEQLSCVPEVHDNQQELTELEPPIVPVTLPPIDETAPELEQNSEPDEPKSAAPALRIDCSEESHGADCTCSRCWLRNSGERTLEALDNQVEHKSSSLVHQHHDAPLTLEDLCTNHVASSLSSDAAAAPVVPKCDDEPTESRASLQPSKIPRPRISYTTARPASLSSNGLVSPDPLAQSSGHGSAPNRRNSLPASSVSRITALTTSTQSRRNPLAAASSTGTRTPSTQSRRSFLAANASSNPSRSTPSQARRNSLASSSIPTRTRTPLTQNRRNLLGTSAATASALTTTGNTSRRQPTFSSSGASDSASGGASAATGNPRPRYLDYAQSPRFAALKAQNLERRRLAEEKSRAHAARTKASPCRLHESALASSSLALSSASSLSSSTASSPCSSTSSASLASSLPPRTARRLDQVRSRLFDFRTGGHPQYEALSDRGSRARLLPCAQMRSQSS